MSRSDIRCHGFTTSSAPLNCPLQFPLLLFLLLLLLLLLLLCHKKSGSLERCVSLTWQIPLIIIRSLSLSPAGQ